MPKKSKAPSDRQDGYLEIDDGVKECTIFLDDKEFFRLYVDNDLHDGYESWDDLMTDCSGKLYASLSDYKKDKSFDLIKWREEYIASL